MPIQTQLLWIWRITRSLPYPTSQNPRCLNVFALQSPFFPWKSIGRGAALGDYGENRAQIDTLPTGPVLCWGQEWSYWLIQQKTLGGNSNLAWELKSSGTSSSTFHGQHFPQGINEVRVGCDLSQRTLVSGFSEACICFSSWIRLQTVGPPLAVSAG